MMASLNNLDRDEINRRIQQILGNNNCYGVLYNEESFMLNCKEEGVDMAASFSLSEELVDDLVSGGNYSIFNSAFRSAWYCFNGKKAAYKKLQAEYLLMSQPPYFKEKSSNVD